MLRLYRWLLVYWWLLCRGLLNGRLLNLRLLHGGLLHGGLLHRWRLDGRLLVNWLLLRLHRLSWRRLVLLGHRWCWSSRRGWSHRGLWWWSLDGGWWC